MCPDQQDPVSATVGSDSTPQNGEVLTSLLQDLVLALADEHVHGVIILGPELKVESGRREVLATHSLSGKLPLRQAADLLVTSSEFERWDGPLVAWQQLTSKPHDGSGDWRNLLIQAGLVSFVRVAMELQGNRFFEVYTFTNAPITSRKDAATLAWAMMGSWPSIRRAIATQRLSLGKRELECLHHLCAGLSAAEVSARMQITERTVTHHISSLARKFGTNGRSALPQLAAWLGSFEIPEPGSDD